MFLVYSFTSPLLRIIPRTIIQRLILIKVFPIYSKNKLKLIVPNAFSIDTP